MTAPPTYRELLAQLADFEARVEAEVNRQVNDAERVETLEARSETNAIRDRIAKIEAKYDLLVRALEPVLGPLHVDEPLVIHEIRAAMEAVEDEIDEARRA